jgi:two-component system NarL family response regulator
MADEIATRVVVADDHPVYREGLALLLNQQPGITVVGVAADGAAALQLCEDLMPDVLLVDLRMEGVGGLAVVKQVADRFPTTRCLVLSGFDADEDVYQAVRAGAAGYLVKQALPGELAAAIQAVNRGEICIPPALAAKLASRLSRPTLTERQEEVLNLIAEGMSNQEIADRLQIVEGTVKAHVKIILSKLGARDRTQAVSVALQRGLVRR